FVVILGHIVRKQKLLYPSAVKVSIYDEPFAGGRLAGKPDNPEGRRNLVDQPTGDKCEKGEKAGQAADDHEEHERRHSPNRIAGMGLGIFNEAAQVFIEHVAKRGIRSEPEGQIGLGILDDHLSGFAYRRFLLIGRKAPKILVLLKLEFSDIIS